MGELKKILETDCDPRLSGELSYSIREAYRYLDSLIESNPVLKNPEMKKSYGHIRQALVDLALRLVLEDSEINSEVKMVSTSNKQNGYTYTMIETKGAIITPTKTSSIKSMPKKALHRSQASIKNKQFNLFETIEDLNEKYDSNTPAFLLLTYGGKNYTLEYVELGLPNVDNEKWIEKVNILNAPRIISSSSDEKLLQNKLNLSLTELSEEILRREFNGTRNI